ncbi:MAG: CvpA family protein, partial [Nitrospinota bacterium]
YGAAVLLRWVSSHAIARGVSFLASFLFAALLIGFMGRLAHRLVRGAQLSWPNRLAGGALGLAEGSALVAVGLLVVGSLSPPTWPPLQGSQLAPHFRPVAAALARLGRADLTSPLPRRLWERARWRSLPIETRAGGPSRDKGRRGERPEGISEEDSRKLEAIIQKGG